MKKFLGYTWVGWLNCLVLRWLGIRLYYVMHNDKVESYGILGFVFPLSGWYNWWPLYWPRPIFKKIFKEMK